MTLYYYTAFEYGLDDILNRHLKVATLDTTNDPNEWVFAVKNGEDSFYPVSWSRSWWHARYKDVYGFICLSESAINPVMWSHYAARHAGVVLAFECDMQATKIRKMNYGVERVIYENPEDADFDKLITHKFKDWSYEEEYRCIASLREHCDIRVANGKLLYFYPLNPAVQLKEVILGCDAYHRHGEITNALHCGKWTGVPVRYARLLETDFRLEIKDTLPESKS